MLDVLDELSDLVLTLLGFALVLAIIGLATGLERALGLSKEDTRKLVHVGVGHWILLAPFIDDLRWALVAPVAFIGLNWLSHRQGTFGAMERSEGADTLGTVFYSVSLTLVVLALFREDQPRWVAVAAIMVMAWGDGLAAVVGTRWGRHPYRGPGGTKSVEGSAAMLVASTVVVLLCQQLGAGAIRPGVALAVAAVATLLEACSPRGTDNLSVPLSTAALLVLL